MIDRPLLREKIIDKMADAFLKALPAGETGFGVLLSRELIRQAMGAAFDACIDALSLDIRSMPPRKTDAD
jgi:hypothetical protein